MKEFSSFIEYIIDVFCFSVPISEDLLTSIPNFIPLATCLFAVALFAFSIAQKTINDVLKENKAIAYIIAIVVIVLSFAFIDLKEFKTIFNILYIPLIFTIRGLEGGLIGTSFKLKTWLWIFVPLISIMVLFYFLLINSNLLSYFVLIWSLTGIIVASYRWMMFLKRKNQFSLNNISYLAIFLIFLSTLIYIPNSKTDMIIYLITLPIGFSVGLLSQSKRFELLLRKEN